MSEHSRHTRRALIAGSAGVAATAALASCGSDVGSVPRVVPNVSDNRWAQLRRALHGELLQAGDPSYGWLRQDVQTQLTAIKDPRGVAVCTDTHDVRTALAWAREQEMPFAVRCGGHSYAGYSNTNGLVIDLSGMRSVVMNRANKRVTAGAGCRGETVTLGARRHGRALPLGRCPNVGLSGLVMGGGFGLRVKEHGLMCDNLVAAEMVTADGEIVQASAREHPDLFWALRGGGGGNFGINTSFTFDTFQPPGTASIAWVLWQATDLTAVVSHLQDIQLSAPRDVGLDTRIKPAAPSGNSSAKQVTVYITAVSNGPKSRLKNLLRPAIEATKPVYASLAAGSWWKVNEATHDQLAPGTAFLTKSSYIADRLSDESLATIFEQLRRYPGSAAQSAGQFWIAGISGPSVPRTATAYVHRNASFLGVIDGTWAISDTPETADRVREWTIGFWDAIQPFVLPQSYQNFIDPTLVHWPSAYYGENWDRLRKVKAKYDSGNVFRSPQSIPPG